MPRANSVDVHHNVACWYKCCAYSERPPLWRAAASQLGRFSGSLTALLAGSAPAALLHNRPGLLDCSVGIGRQAENDVVLA